MLLWTLHCQAVATAAAPSNSASNAPQTTSASAPTSGQALAAGSGLAPAALTAVAAPNAEGAMKASASALAPLPAMPACEQNVLNALGWQQAYNPRGYSINAELSTKVSLDAWESLGCLTSLTNLTLGGTMPSLPDSWAANGSFPALRSMNFSSANLVGSLPASWGKPGAFPELLNMNFSSTQLFGRLPGAWGNPQAFSKLQELHLQQLVSQVIRQIFVPSFCPLTIT